MGLAPHPSRLVSIRYNLSLQKRDDKSNYEVLVTPTDTQSTDGDKPRPYTLLYSTQLG